MKNKRWSFWVLLLVMAFITMAGGCGGGSGGGSPSSNDEKTLTVSPSDRTLQVGGSATLTASNYTGALKWLSEDENIAKVENTGTATASVNAVSLGTTNIVVTDDSGQEATCRVTVTTGTPGTDPTPGNYTLDGTWVVVSGVMTIEDEIQPLVNITKEGITFTVIEATESNGAPNNAGDLYHILISFNQSLGDWGSEYGAYPAYMPDVVTGIDNGFYTREGNVYTLYMYSIEEQTDVADETLTLESSSSLKIKSEHVLGGFTISAELVLQRK
jgi:hypothetical protein